MKRLVSLLALLLPLAAMARPLLVPPKRLELPPVGPPEQQSYLGPNYFSVAIDGDVVLAAARRAINEDNERVYGVYIFQRAGDGSWNYAGPLTEGAQSNQAVVLGGNVATVFETNNFRVFERGAQGWSQTASFQTTNFDAPFRIEDGSIFTRQTSPSSCNVGYVEYRKVNGTWQVAGNFNVDRCGGHYPDINNGRALVEVSSQDSRIIQEPAPLFRKINGTWSQVATIAPPRPDTPYVNWFGPGAQNGTMMFLSPNYLFRNAGNDNWQLAGTFTQPEIDLTGGYNLAGGPVLHGNNLLLYGPERDYEMPSHDIDYSFVWNTVRIYRPAADGTAAYFARLNPDFDAWFWSVSDDGRRVVAAGPDNNAGFDPVRYLYVFEIPDSHTFPSLEQDTFASGNLARWSPSTGQFSVVQSNGTRVLRQSSLTGDAGATLTALDWTDQAIEADIRPLEFSGSDRWFGLVTRRTDAQNYYYVTFRQPGIVSLRRVRNGIVTTLVNGSAPEPFTVGRSYRVRLESVGDQHAVFLEGIPRAFAKDATLSHGRPGVAGYRTRFDVDNVVVTGGTRLLAIHDGMENFINSGSYSRGTGNWITITIDDEQDSFHSYLRQTDTSGDARVFTRAPITNQVVSARMQPLTFGATTGGQDPWFGIAARVVDERNYLYMTLRRSNQLSLRKVVNGAVQVIATVPVTVSTNQWYDLRLEVVGNSIRAFVNGDLKIETSDPGVAGSGRSAVLMYRTSADLWSWIAYQP